MNPARSPMRRFLLQSLWLVLPLCALLGLTWHAWRADAETRQSRIVQAANRMAERALEETRTSLGGWFPVTDHNAGVPPLPVDDPKAQETLKRYEAGDFEGVLGSRQSLLSPAGLPLRSLAALQLLRKETDPSRMAELVSVLATTVDFMTPKYLEEVEKRYREVKLPTPPALAGWQRRWQREQLKVQLAHSLDATQPVAWRELAGVDHLVEFRAASRECRVTLVDDVRTVAEMALITSTLNLTEGLSIRLTVAGITVAGHDGGQVISTLQQEGWKADVVMTDPAAYERGDIRTRNSLAAVLGLAGLAAVFGLFQSGRAYLRAVELARRQSEFMAAVSHEMRTPLAAMGLLAENLDSGAADRAGQRDEHVRMIREESARLGSLIDNVLAFTRDKPMETLDDFEVSAMIADAASLMKPLAARKSITFEVDVTEFPESPCGDAAALRRVLLNLLDNAIKHTPAGGMVRCIARPVGTEHWSIEVIDSGPGIPVHERARIFEAFYRIGDELRRSTPGTGLGLALVKRTAEAHGGRIEVDDAPGGGSRFTLTLPLKP